ncbi:MAG TPA: MurT ligase domain-containing protein [Acidimicrobiales bacterium]|nr:MurT ligase domain-containing protein [Acidimicrobiales bacterium]
MSPAVRWRTKLAARAGQAAGAVSKRVGAGGGSVIGGRVILALDGDALAHLASGHPAVLVSGTNGKTTTTRLLARALEQAGPVVTNTGGANMPAGLAAAMATATPGAYAALEVDEAHLRAVAASVRPRVLCLLNLSRDQLDRVSEVRMLAARWRDAVADLAARDAPATVVANADDPMVAWAAGDAENLVWVAAGLSWTLDAGGCPACGGRILFEADGWRCSGCDLRRPRPDLRLENGAVVDADGGKIDFELSLPGRVNRANAVMAAAASRALTSGALGLAEALAAAATVSEVTGRYGEVVVAGHPARLLLSKNPAGWMEIFDFLSPPPAPVVVAINARVADGRDPSWLWDVPFDRLAGRHVVATGERCRDLAVRLRYAGVEHSTVEDLAGAVAAGASRAGGRPVDVVGNYTSFQALRRLARDRS